MANYIVETRARASIREFWEVEAADETEAREAIEDGGGIAANFLFDETTGDEDEREVIAVHALDYIAGSLALRRAQDAAPAMLAALQEAARGLKAASEALCNLDPMAEAHDAAAVDDAMHAVGAAIAAATNGEG